MRQLKLKHKIAKKTKINSGLVRKDKFNWPAALKRIASKRKYQTAIVTFGTNDLTGFRKRGGAVHYSDPKWDGLYAAQVKNVVQTLKASGMIVCWVGLPITRKNRYQADYRRLNKIFRKASTAAGAIYIDTWKAFAK